MNEITVAGNPAIKPRFVQDTPRSPGGRLPKTRRLTATPTFAITSGKGGVGKTNVAANLAAALTQKRKRIMVIDADLGLANLDLLLGVKPTYTLADFFAGAAALEEILVPNENGILLLPGASGVQEITSLRRDQKLALLTELDAMSREMDMVLVDTASGISDAVTYFTTAAQEIVIVVTPEPSSVTDAYAVVKVLASVHRQNRFWILANHVSGEEQGRRLFDALSRTALRFLNASLDFLGWVPRDPQLLRAVARSQMVVLETPEAPSAQAFDRIAERLIQRAAAGVQVKGNVQFFLRRILAAERGEQ
jgi:flagellar biosynthesis protein FlhG